MKFPLRWRTSLIMTSLLIHHHRSPSPQSSHLPKRAGAVFPRFFYMSTSTSLKISREAYQIATDVEITVQKTVTEGEWAPERSRVKIFGIWGEVFPCTWVFSLLFLFYNISAHLLDFYRHFVVNTRLIAAKSIISPKKSGDSVFWPQGTRPLDLFSDTAGTC